MRVTFVLPFRFATGGTRIAAQYAERLRRFGHETSVVYPTVPYRFRASRRAGAGIPAWLATLAGNLLPGAPVPGPAFPSPLRSVPVASGAFLPDADVVVATAWPTAVSVARLPAVKGVKCYLVQHREIDSGRVDDVDATYRLPLFRIAGSRFTADELRRELGVAVDAVVPNGIDVGFWSAGGASAPRSGVLMPFRPEPRKGADDGIAAIHALRERFPGFPVRFFGSRRTGAVPSFAEFARNPSDAELRDLYRRSLVFLYPSRYEGFGLPPLEAMAAGCAVVSTATGALTELLAEVPSAAVLVPPGDPDAMARALVALADDPVRCAAMGAAGALASRRHDLAAAALAFEAALLRARSTRPGEERSLTHPLGQHRADAPPRAGEPR